MKYFRYAFICYLLAGISSVQGAPETQPPNEIIRVAVASNFKPALEQLVTEFKRHNPAYQVQISSASSGVLFAQISRGAPFDLFLSADELRPTLLEEQELVVENSRFTYALGKLVFWSSDKAVKSREDLGQYTGKIAMANPELAPFGRASQQALTALVLWPEKKKNIVMANNVLQVAHMLHSGAVKLGLVSASQVNNVPKQQWWYVPKELFTPIVQQMVILNQAKRDSHHLRRVETFYRYLLSAKGQQIIAKNGYAIVSGSFSTNGVTGV
jgi:molybdate transport system substrate-binding protein